MSLQLEWTSLLDWLFLVQHHGVLVHIASSMIFKWWCLKILWFYNKSGIKVFIALKLVLKATTNRTLEHGNVILINLVITHPHSCAELLIILCNSFVNRNSSLAGRLLSLTLVSLQCGHFFRSLTYFSGHLNFKQIMSDVRMLSGALQARTGLQPAHTWFLEIAFVCDIGMCVCACMCA